MWKEKFKEKGGQHTISNNQEDHGVSQTAVDLTFKQHLKEQSDIFIFKHQYL